tara:strand:+ start:1710 stop:2858 length:1149 start_codon:yes stop_codon:yes gene_type:complete
MKKIIFKNFLTETTQFFLLSSCAVTIIVWVIQAVNYLEFVTEDGHSFKIYFLYTIYSLPKIFNRLLPFMFFFSVFFTLIKYEEQNQILIFWTNGIKKKTLLNVIITYSLFFLILNSFFSLLIVPLSQDKARSYIRESNIDYLPFLIKPKKFIDTVEKLTIYADKKNEDILENIIIKDAFSSSKSKIIYAKKGFFTVDNEENFLVLNDGKILNISEGKTNSFDFNQTQINLSKYTSKTTKTPKLQEVSTIHLFYCLFKTKNIIIDKDAIAENLKFKCDDTISLKNKISQELFSRIFKPIYLPLLALIGGLLIIRSKNSERYSNYKLKIFILGVFVISLSEISTKFYSINFFETSMIFIIPFMLFLSIYYFFLKQFNIKKIYDN